MLPSFDNGDDFSEIVEGYLTATAGLRGDFRPRNVPFVGFAASRDGDTIATQLATTDGAIGWVELPVAQAYHLATVKLPNGAGQWVAATPDTAKASVAALSDVSANDDFNIATDYRSKAPGAYPMVVVTYCIICGAGYDVAKLRLIKSFFHRALTDAAQADLATAGYTPLPAAIRARATTVVDRLA